MEKFKQEPISTAGAMPEKGFRIISEPIQTESRFETSQMVIDIMWSDDLDDIKQTLISALRSSHLSSALVSIISKSDGCEVEEFSGVEISEKMNQIKRCRLASHQTEDEIMASLVDDLIETDSKLKNLFVIAGKSFSSSEPDSVYSDLAKELMARMEKTSFEKNCSALGEKVRRKKI